MDLSKSQEYFDPNEFKEEVHVIGCGAIGSHIIESLARLGVKEFHIWDFDTVSEHNIANQMFTTADINNHKTAACWQFAKEINPEIKVHTHSEGWNGEELNGYVFMGVDSIDTRKQIVDHCITRIGTLKALFDFRMRLEDAQHYASLGDFKSLSKLKETMNFSNDDADKETPVSACNVALSVNPTVKTIVALGIANFLNLVLRNQLKKMILLDAFAMTLDVF